MKGRSFQFEKTKMFEEVTTIRKNYSDLEIYNLVPNRAFSGFGKVFSGKKQVKKNSEHNKPSLPFVKRNKVNHFLK